MKRRLEFDMPRHLGISRTTNMFSSGSSALPRLVMQLPRSRHASRTERCLAWACRACHSMEHQARRYAYYASRRAVATCTFGHSIICPWPFAQFLQAYGVGRADVSEVGDTTGRRLGNGQTLSCPTHTYILSNFREQCPSLSSVNRICFPGDASMRTGSEILVGHAMHHFACTSRTRVKK